MIIIGYRCFRPLCLPFFSVINSSQAFYFFAFFPTSLAFPVENLRPQKNPDMNNAVALLSTNLNSRQPNETSDLFHDILQNHVPFWHPPPTRLMLSPY